MPSIHHELIIGAPAQKVYSAITTQDGLSGWWTPDTIAKAELNSTARFGFGPNYFKEMKITELLPSKSVKWSCIAGAEEWIGTSLSFELVDGNKKTISSDYPETGDQMQQQKSTDSITLLILHHDEWKAYTPMYAECTYTGGQFLRSLKAYCESGKGKPWPHQHRE